MPQAVILAGGLGTRLKPFTEIIPKPLLPVGEKAVLEIQILTLKKYGFDEIYIATNYKSEYIESFLGDGSRYGVNLFFSKEKRPLGTAGPLTLLKDKLERPFLVMNGDILTKLNFKKMYQFALEKGAILTVGTKKWVTPFNFGNIVSNGDYIKQVEEKPELVFEIIAGIYVMQPEIFKYIPENKYYGIDKLIQSLLSRGIPVARYLINEYWLDIGQIDDYFQAQKIYDTHFKGSL